MNQEQQQEVPTVAVQLPIEGWNVVIEALAGMPYAKVYQVVASIHQQVQAQQEPQMDNINIVNDSPPPEEDTEE